jgi:hypothetical protein
MSDPVAAAPAASAPAAAPAAPAATPVAAAPAPAAPGAAGALVDPAAAAPAAEPVKVTLPGKDAKPEEWAKYFDDIGAPKDASGYSVQVPEGQDDGFAKVATSWFAEARLTPAQANTLAAKWNGYMGEMTTAQKEAAAKAETAANAARDTAARNDEAALKNEWGAKGDENMALSKRAVREFVSPFAGAKTGEVITAIENAIGYGATLRLMHAIGSRVGEAAPRGLGEGAAPKAPGLEDNMRSELNKVLGRA